MEHIFAGNVSLPKETQVQSSLFPRDWEVRITERPDRNTIYLHGTTHLVGSKELLGYIQTLVGELLSFDISHTGDTDPDMIELFSVPKDGSNYSYTAVHGKSFQDVCGKYRDGQGVVSIRTAEESKHLGGKVIKVDTIS